MRAGTLPNSLQTLDQELAANTARRRRAACPRGPVAKRPRRRLQLPRPQPRQSWVHADRRPRRRCWARKVQEEAAGEGATGRHRGDARPVARCQPHFATTPRHDRYWLRCIGQQPTQRRVMHDDQKRPVAPEHEAGHPGTVGRCRSGRASGVVRPSRFDRGSRRSRRSTTRAATRRWSGDGTASDRPRHASQIAERHPLATLDRQRLYGRAGHAVGLRPAASSAVTRRRRAWNSSRPLPTYPSFRASTARRSGAWRTRASDAPTRPAR